MCIIQEHEECFAYSQQTFCDRNNFVLTAITVPGNVHDSVSFYQAYNVVNDKYRGKIRNVCLDAGYNVSHICRAIYQNDQQPILPYHRPMGKKDGIKKKEFKYDQETDRYICPQGCILEYVTTTREGYRHYRCKDCESCPLKERCTASKEKSIFIHIWEHYRNEADEYRHTEQWEEIYPKRKQTIERVFGDAKENHCLRYTRLRGLKKNQHQALIIFACHNLKKMGLWDWKYKEKYFDFSFSQGFLIKLFSEAERKSRFLGLTSYKNRLCQQSEGVIT